MASRSQLSCEYNGVTIPKNKSEIGWVRPSGYSMGSSSTWAMNQSPQSLLTQRRHPHQYCSLMFRHTNLPRRATIVRIQQIVLLTLRRIQHWEVGLNLRHICQHYKKIVQLMWPEALYHRTAQNSSAVVRPKQHG